MVRIEYCEFDDTVLYEPEGLVWVKPLDTEKARIGITSIMAYIAGRLNRVKIKPIGTIIESGKSIASIESLKYFNIVRSPFDSEIMEINDRIVVRPKLINDSPYSDGWIAVVKVKGRMDMLKPLDLCKDMLVEKIRSMRVRCFSAFPDHEIFEIGVECAAVLPKLNNLVASIGSREVIHIVSDDPTADIEMIRWSEETGNELLEIRKEDTLLHFIVRKP